jgi:hypothetical protein
VLRRRLERDRNRVHGYHDDLGRASFKRLATLADFAGDKAEADRRRERLRVAAIEREYRAELDDLRHNYALRVTLDWVQALERYVPVQRFEVPIRRRKGERLIRLDWHPLIRLIEPLPCEAGLGLDRVRLVCDGKLHLIKPAGQAPCTPAARPFAAPGIPPRARVVGPPSHLQHKLQVSCLPTFPCPISVTVTPEMLRASRSLPSNSWWQSMVGWQVLSRPSAAEGGGRRPTFTGLATQPYSATEVDGWQ